MANILIVGQKELTPNPMFKQDKNILEVYEILKKGNDVKILYLHKNLVKKSEESNDVTMTALQQFCVKDMIRKNRLKINLRNFIKEHGIETIVFMSLDMARFIMPYMEDFIGDINIICDFRFSRIYTCLKDYKEKIENETKRDLKLLLKKFRTEFLKVLPILYWTDSIILDENCYTELLREKKVKNIICIEQLKEVIVHKNNLKKDNKKNYSVVDISISRNNYNANSITSKFECQNKQKYDLCENKNVSLIDSINKIIEKSKADSFFIHTNKIIFEQKTLDLLTKFLFVDDNIALAAPSIIYSSDISDLKTQFENQRFGNFSFWEESGPLSFSNAVIIKKSFLYKVGFFDNKFKTFDYALFDLILRLYQRNAYCCEMHDVVVFKNVKIDCQLSLIERDKIYLCNKWGESNFNMAI